MRTFIETNVLIYADDTANSAKQDIALNRLEALRRSGSGVLSIQVLQEYFAAATKKLGIDAALAQRRVQLFSQFDVVIPSVQILDAAIDTHRLRAISFWDSMIVQAAISSGCAILLTEDMQHGETISGLRLENPFV